MTSRRRHFFVLLLVAALLVSSAVIIVTKPTKLGLDLQGGVELVYQVKARAGQPPPTSESIESAIDVMRERVDQLGVAEPELQQSGSDQINVALPDVSNLQEAIKQVGTVAQMAFYDWEPNVIGPDGRPDPSNPQVTGGGGAAGSEVVAHELFDALEIAEKRDPEPDLNTSRDGPLYFAVDRDKEEVFGLGEESRADAMANVPAARRGDAEVITVQPGTVLLRAEKRGSEVPSDRWFVLRDDVALEGREIRNPEQNFDRGATGSGGPIVTFEFTDAGRRTWQQVTREIAERGSASVGILPGQSAQDVNQHFAIALDNELVSVPFIDFRRNPDGIDGRTGSQIEGGFTIQTAQELANVLKTGALPVQLELISSSQISATLGQQALDRGLVAGAAGFIVVALFLLTVYRLLGVIAVIALAIYGVYFVALMKLIPVVLTLPGIAGLVLTLGVAADANIVIFERVKEEVRAGRSISASIATGYKKGLTAIIDANVVIVMVAFILFVLATAGVQGFALTLGLGVIVSLFTAVVATQAILGTMGTARWLTKPSALGAGRPKGDRLKIDYMGYSKWFFAASGVILVICALALGSKGLTFGIDFESGTRINATTSGQVDERAVREVLRGEGLGDAKIQRVTSDGAAENTSEFQISTESLRPTQISGIYDALEGGLELADTPSSTSIGPTFGRSVANSAIIAIIASLFVISAYLALRFEPKYAVPVLIGVAHDILITAGIYAFLGQEVSTATVAALLTILGYSLYDTIIVFDRIRENVPRMPRATFAQIVNRSMAEVIVRSLATTFSTALPVLMLLLFGGETLEAFAVALLIGTLSGTYSSIFIAGPVLTAWKEREPIYRRRTAAALLEGNGFIPAYAAVPGDVGHAEPKSRPPRARRVTAPEDPEGNVSREEFEEMVRDLHVDPPGSASAAVVDRAKPAKRTPKPAAPRDPSADAQPEDLVSPRDPEAAPKRKRPSTAAKRKGKHGRPR